VVEGSDSGSIAADGASGLRPWRPALVRSGAPNVYDRLELLMFAAVMVLAFATPPRDATGQVNAPFQTFFQETTGGGICLWKRFTGRDCGGCGLTRGFVQLAHGHPVEAVRLNPMTPLVFLWFAWHTAVVAARNAGWRLVHGLPTRLVWWLYGLALLGFAALGFMRLILGVGGV
jgi:hypothetical protein